MTLTPHTRHRISALVISILYWAVFNVAGNTREPWDGPLYWVLAYPLACALAAAIGWMLPRRAWQWGAIIIGAQAVFLLWTDWTPMLVPAAMMLIVLALPAMMMSWLTGRLRRARDVSEP